MLVIFKVHVTFAIFLILYIAILAFYFYFVFINNITVINVTVITNI